MEHIILVIPNHPLIRMSSPFSNWVKMYQKVIDTCTEIEFSDVDDYMRTIKEVMGTVEVYGP
jgi:hypothetical protein